MAIEDVARNVKINRIAKGFSQRKLAEVAGISEIEVKKIEAAHIQPKVRTLEAIARALNIRLDELFTPVEELKAVRFRSFKKMKKRDHLLAKIKKWLDDFNFLEDVLNKKEPFYFNSIEGQCIKSDPKEAAYLCREKLGLDLKVPIHDICGLLEKAGIKILILPIASEGFFGLSINDKDRGPAIIVNDWDRITVERRIFSAAHELGHIMLHPESFDMSEIQEDEKEEREANRFASHFLMPDEGFFNEWNEAAGLHWVDRVLKVKSIYQVSYKTVLYRLIEHKIVDDSIWKKFCYAYTKRYGKKLSFKEEPDWVSKDGEPYKLVRFVFCESRFSRLVREAVKEDKISLSRGAEMLGIGINEMLELVQSWEAVA